MAWLKLQRWVRKIGARQHLPIFLFAFYGLLFVGAGFWTSQSRAAAPAGITSGSETAAQFVGSRKCAECHPREHAEWQSSQHAVAMQEANDKTVFGRFDGSTFSHGGVTSSLYRKG